MIPSTLNVCSVALLNSTGHAVHGWCGVEAGTRLAAAHRVTAPCMLPSSAFYIDVYCSDVCSLTLILTNLEFLANFDSVLDVDGFCPCPP